MQAGCDGRGGGLWRQALRPVWLHVGDQVTPCQLWDAAGWLPGEVPDASVQGGKTWDTRRKPVMAAAGGREMLRLLDAPSQRDQVLLRAHLSPPSVPFPTTGTRQRDAAFVGVRPPMLGELASGP